MPSSIIIALAAGAVSGGAALIAGTAAEFAFGWAAFATSLVLGGLSKALAKKPSAPGQGSVFDSQGRNVSVRQPIAPWQVVVGEARVGGVVTFASMSDNNYYLHMVVTFACHSSDSFGDIYIDDDLVTADMIDAPSGVITSGHLSGTFDMAMVDTRTVPGTPFQVTVVTIAPPASQIVPGAVLTLGSVESVVWTQYDGFGSVTGTTPLVEGVDWTRSGFVFTFLARYAGEEVTINWTQHAVSSHVRILRSVGDEPYGTQPFPSLVAESGGKWTDAHRQDGHTKIYFRFATPHTVSITGFPQISAVLRGLKLYDPRTGLTTWQANPALAAVRYLCDTDFGLGASYADEVSDDALIAAANECDEQIELALAGSPTTYEARYSANGSFLTSERPRDILERLLGVMGGGRLAHVSDRWWIFAGGYEAPTETLDEGEFAGPVHFEPMPPREAWANGARGTFVDPNRAWQPTDLPAIASAAYLAADGGERMWADMDFTGFCTSATEGQRKLKIELLRRRNALTVSATFRLSAWRVMTGRTVALDFDKYGFSAKAFEVVDGAFTVIDSDAGPALGVKLTLRETGPAIWDWGTDEEQPQAALATTNLPNPFDVGTPGTPTVTEELQAVAGDRFVNNRVTVSWGAAMDAFVDRYELRYKNVLAAAYTETASTQGLSMVIEDLVAGYYIFQVRAINLQGKAGEWATKVQEITGLAALPVALTGLALQKIGSYALLTWTLSPDIDVRIGGRILIRHSEASSSTSWEESFSIGNDNGYPGASVMAVVPLKGGTYFIRPEDSSGQQSLTTTSVVSDGATALTYSPLSNVAEDPAFSGTHSGTIDIAGVLKLSSDGYFDDIADFDLVASLDNIGDVLASGTYGFAVGLDLGSVKRVQLYSEIEGIVVNVNDMFDGRTGNIDDWLDFDGNSGGGSADAWVEARSTNQNPVGSPSAVWSAWNRLDVSEYQARGFELRAQLRSYDPAYNIHVSRLRVYAQEIV